MYQKLLWALQQNGWVEDNSQKGLSASVHGQELGVKTGVPLPVPSFVWWL